MTSLVIAVGLACLLPMSVNGQDCSTGCTLGSTFQFNIPAGVNSFTAECGSSAGGTGIDSTGTALNNGGAGVIATATVTGLTTADKFYFFLGTSSDQLFGGQSSSSRAGNGASPLTIYSQGDDTGYLYILGGGGGGSLNKGGDAGFGSGSPGTGLGAGQGATGSAGGAGGVFTGFGE